MKISKRHLAKTISWRIVGTIDTLLLAWFISGNLFVGAKISVLEMITKMIFYYLHERIWFRSNISATNKRHILKTFSWRAVGTLDTIFLAWLISGNPYVGLKIGTAEVITKMMLYYIHEKIWYKINYGLNSRNIH